MSGTLVSTALQENLTTCNTTRGNHYDRCSYKRQKTTLHQRHKYRLVDEEKNSHRQTAVTFPNISTSSQQLVVNKPLTAQTSSCQRTFAYGLFRQTHLLNNRSNPQNHHRQIKSQHFLLILSPIIVIGLLINPSGFVLPTAEGTPLDDMYRKWTHEDDHTLHAATPEDFNKESILTSGAFDIEIFVSNLTLEIKVDGKRVLYKHNQTVRSLPNAFRPTHRGVGMVVLHPTTGQVLLTGHYETNQPMAYRPFLETLNNLQAGRILVLAAPGDWRTYMNEASVEFLSEYLGGWLVNEGCIGEMWAGVGMIDGPLWAETLTTIANFKRPSRSSPLYMAVTVPKSLEKNRCEWYSDPKHEHRARFCETYEGYRDFCSCNVVHTVSPANAPPLEMREQIPIVIATARHQFKVLRQIQQLWTQAGGGNTSILISVDGLQKEAREFTKIMGLQAVFHLNPAALGTLARISQHIKFSIFQAFKLNPEANKIIVLEDDIVIAPDFISYFHQTAPLLDADKTIFCINAYNYNSFLPTAIDTSRLYREEVFPAYGWMITRELSQELLVEWPSMAEFADWDWYMRARMQKGRVIVTPEVPRTYHNGNGGFHVSGWEQSAYFDRRALNADPEAKVNISYLTKDAYELFLENELRNATVLEIKEHPCDKEYIPKEKVGSFVVYVYGEHEKDDSYAYFTLATCLNGYEKGRMEHHHYMFTLGYYGNSLYIIACPGSYYCRVKEEDYGRLVYNPSHADFMRSMNYKQKYVKHMTHISVTYRVNTTNFFDEVTLQNYVNLETSFMVSEVGEDGKMLM